MNNILKFNHIKLAGFATSVPELQIDNSKSDLFTDEADYIKFIETTGIQKRHVVGDSGLCTSDLCVDAASRLLKDLNWSLDSIDVLIFVTQTPDYSLPATACIIQNRLGLSERTYALDISLGCSGWVYGLSVVSALLESGVFKRGILLAGDTTTVTKSPFDRSTYPLFGDAGTATAVEYHPHFGQTAFEFGTDGSGFESIMIRDGGYRFPTNADSLITEIKPDGKKRNNLQSILNGAEVFTFGISQAPRSIKNLLKGIECEVETIDLFLFHQANNMMNERIRQKLGIETHKVPYSLEHFGNTSSASIVLTLCTHKSDWNGKKSIIACGFGVGLSWGSVYFEVENPFVSEVNYVKNIEQ